MRDQSSLVFDEDGIWSAVGRFRSIFLIVGVFGLIASAGLAIVLFATQPVYTSRTVQIWENLLGPLSGPGGGTEKTYKVNVSHPAEMYLEDDLPITVSLSDVAATHNNDPNARVQISLEGPSFKVAPADGVSLELKDGRSVSFIVSASAAGNRSLRVVDRFWITDAPDIREKPFPSSGLQEDRPRKSDAADARLISIFVRERPTFYILDRMVIKNAQAIAAIVGVPGLLIFLLSGWREKRKDREQRLREESGKRVSAPHATKPRKVER